MTIRIATIHDRDKVLRLLNQLGEVINSRVYFDEDNIHAHELGTENYASAMKRDDRIVFVSEERKRVIAVATFFILTNFITGKPFAHIDDFVVEKKLRGKGIGSALLEFIKQYAKDHGINSIELTSSLPLAEAHRFYEQHGGVFRRKVISFDL